jgi:hypothetical protein
MGSILYFLLWAGLFFVMMRFGCGAHVMGHGHHHGNSPSNDPNASSGSRGRCVPPARTSPPSRWRISRKRSIGLSPASR